jgi:O-antigen/teichoic acid export membrane protein
MGILGGGVVTAAATEANGQRGQGRAHLLDAAFTFAMRVASAGLVFVLQVFLARTMDLGDYGSYVTAWTWLVMLGAFMPLGFAESAVRFVPRYRARARHGSAVAFWRFGLRVVLLVSLLMAGIAAIVALAGGLADSRTGLIVLLVAAGLPFLAVQNFLEGIARAHGWYKLTSVPIYVIRPLLIMGGCGGLAWAGLSLSLVNVGSVVVAAMALVSLGLFAALVRAMWRQPMPAGDDEVTGSRRVWLKASLPLITTGRQREILIAGMTAVLFNVGLSVLLIPHFGIEGAAAATAAAMVVRSLMQCLAVRRSLNLSVISLGLPSLRLSAAG